MDELPPHARRALEVARTLDDPEPTRRDRADAALRNALAAHGVTSLPPLAASSLQAAQAVARSSLRLSLGVKVALGLGAVAALALGVWQLRTAPEPKPASASQPAPPAARQTSPAPDLAREPALAGAGATTPRLAPHARAAHPRKLAADDDALRGELQLLAAVDGMLRSGRYRDALRTLSESERSGSGVLAEERRALRVLALCGAGQASGPREREEYLARAPRSVLAERVRAACIAHLVDEP